MGRIACLLTLLTLPVAASAQIYTYIIPAYAHPRPIWSEGWESQAVATRLSAGRATAKEIGYPYGGSGPCAIGEVGMPEALHSRFGIIGCSMDPPPSMQFAIVVTTNVPLAVTSEASLYVSDPLDTDYSNPELGIVGKRAVTVQSIPVATAWLDPDVDHIIPDITVGQRYASDTYRTNLFVVNPNPAPLDVRYQRFGYGPVVLPGPVHSLTVAPEGASRVALPFERETCFLFNDVLQCSATLVISANAKFYAFASVINNRTNDAVSRAPVQ